MKYFWPLNLRTSLCERRILRLRVLNCCLSFLVLLFSFPVVVSAEVATLDEFQALGEKFDHLTTGYALTGEHGQLECGECHIGGVFEALPRECEACHDNVIAAGMTSTHVETTAPCDTCHTTAGFVSAAVMDHSIVTGSCSSCHDGVASTGKSANHVATTNLCDACHTTNLWSPVRIFDHEQSVGSCVTCHNNIITAGKSAMHMPTTDSCGACHLYSMGPAWPAFTVDHAEVLGRCSFCHNGTIAIGKDADHEVTNEECNACHTPGGLWINVTTTSLQLSNNLLKTAQSKPVNTLHSKVTDNCGSCHTDAGSYTVVSVDHAEVIPPCAGCHDGTSASGKGSTHIATVEDCGSCHSPNMGNWAINPSVN